MGHTKNKWKVDGLFIYSETPDGLRTMICEMDNTSPPIEEMKANAQLITAAPETKQQHDDLLEALKGDEENCIPNAQTILSQALLGNYEAVKSMLKELCSIHAKAIAAVQDGNS